MTMKKNIPSICIVDDERSIGSALMRLFRRLDATVEAFMDPEAALQWMLENPVDIVITDQRMPGMTGTELVEALDKAGDTSTRFVLSGYSDFDDITLAFNSGLIQKYVSKPWDDDELLFAVGKVLSSNAGHDAHDPALAPQPAGASVGILLGSDPVMQALYEQIRKMSTANVPIFIHGETGTGKELVARALHMESFRSQSAFVPVNCANFSATLMESQLFGHKKGAFTGADKNHEGLLAAANGGTLFLDEVTTLPLELQSKLLRVLQEREYSPLGTTELIPFDAQVLSASGKRLSAAVNEGIFRDDLKYRLEVLPLDIPPLRERGRDAVILFDHYLRQVREDTRFEFSQEFERFLQEYHWPGNVRQLVNVAGYVATMADDPVLEISCLPSEVQAEYMGDAKPGATISETQPLVEESIKPLKDVEREAIEKALLACDQNIPRAAAMLGVSASTIYRKMQAWEQEDAAS